ncbi:MAG: hypothetical protein AAF718_09140 [Pseudomonadota bacterium]
MANDGTSGSDRSDNDKSSDHSSKSERADREVSEKSRDALSGGDTDVKDREPTPEDRAASQEKMQAEGQAAKGRLDTASPETDAGQTEPETTSTPEPSDIVEAIKGGMQNAQANPVPAGSYKQAELTFTPPGTFQNPAAPTPGLGRVVRPAAFAGSAVFAAAAANHVLNKGYDAAETHVFENPGVHIERRIADIWDAANARVEQLGAQAHPGIYEAAANAELELRDFAVAHFQDTGAVYEHGYNAEAQAPLNDLWAENLTEVNSVERSRDEARAMMEDYADHWGIDAGDVTPEQWSDIAGAPDPLEVVPNINDPRFAAPVPAREAIELDAWVEGFSPAEPLPPNGGFTPVPTPPFVEEFPAGDRLDLPNNTGGVAPVAETEPLITLPPEDVGPDIVTMGHPEFDGTAASEETFGFVPELPANWESAPTRKGVGIRWSDPENQGNGVRIDKGNPGSPFPSQQVDHVIVRHNGEVLGRDGLPIQGAIADHPEMAHIPLEEYREWTAWNRP